MHAGGQGFESPHLHPAPSWEWAGWTAPDGSPAAPPRVTRRATRRLPAHSAAPVARLPPVLTVTFHPPAGQPGWPRSVVDRRPARAHGRWRRPVTAAESPAGWPTGGDGTAHRRPRRGGGRSSTGAAKAVRFGVPAGTPANHAIGPRSLPTHDHVACARLMAGEGRGTGCERPAARREGRQSWRVARRRRRSRRSCGAIGWRRASPREPWRRGPDSASGASATWNGGAAGRRGGRPWPGSPRRCASAPAAAPRSRPRSSAGPAPPGRGPRPALAGSARGRRRGGRPQPAPAPHQLRRPRPRGGRGAGGAGRAPPGHPDRPGRLREDAPGARWPRRRPFPPTRTGSGWWSWRPWPTRRSCPRRRWWRSACGSCPGGPTWRR